MVETGVKTEFITRLAEGPIYDQTFRIAEARLPVDGQAGSVTYFFNPEVDLSPHVGEDGTADFRDLDFVKSVKAGDLLCRLTPAKAAGMGRCSAAQTPSPLRMAWRSGPPAAVRFFPGQHCGGQPDPDCGHSGFFHRQY